MLESFSLPSTGIERWLHGDGLGNYAVGTTRGTWHFDASGTPSRVGPRASRGVRTRFDTTCLGREEGFEWIRGGVSHHVDRAPSGHWLGETVRAAASPHGELLVEARPYPGQEACLHMFTDDGEAHASLIVPRTIASHLESRGLALNGPWIARAAFEELLLIHTEKRITYSFHQPGLANVAFSANGDEVVVAQRTSRHALRLLRYLIPTH